MLLPGGRDWVSVAGRVAAVWRDTRAATSRLGLGMD